MQNYLRLMLYYLDAKQQKPRPSEQGQGFALVRQTCVYFCCGRLVWAISFK